MIDWIKITLRDFTGNFDNCKRLPDRVDEETGVLYENYYLPNHHKPPKQHRMKIHRQAGSNKVYVKGSLRKRHYDCDTYFDLTVQRFEETLKELARKLNIPFEELCLARFTQCEIGLNIKTSTPCHEIIPMVVRYGGLKKNDKFSVEYESIYFDGATKRLKIYDKIKEVTDNAEGAANRRFREKAYDVLRKSNYNLLRIEYTLFNQKGFTQHKMGHIKTVGDLIAHYGDLYKFWCRETGRIVLFNKAIKPNKDKMAKSDFEIGVNLALHGFEKAIELNQAGINKDAKTVTSMQSRALRKLLTVVKKHYQGMYNTYTLRLDVMRHLKKESERRPEMHLLACFMELLADRITKSASSINKQQ